MPTLDYTFTSCRTLLDIHAATYTTMRKKGATSRNRVELAQETNGIATLPANWESLKSILKSLKTSMDFLAIQRAIYRSLQIKRKTN